MHSHLPLGLPYATWLLSQPWCPPKYKPIRGMALSSLLTKEQRGTRPRLDGQRKYAVHRAQKRDRGSTLILTAAMQSFSLVITFCSPLSTSLWKWERQAPNLSFAHRLLVLFKLYKYYLRWLTSSNCLLLWSATLFFTSAFYGQQTQNLLCFQKESSRHRHLFVLITTKRILP